MAEDIVTTQGPVIHRNPDGTATLAWPLGWPDTTVVHRSVLEEWVATNNALVAERVLADRLFEAMGAVEWAIPSFDPSLVIWNAAVTAYEEARRG